MHFGAIVVCVVNGRFAAMDIVYGAAVVAFFALCWAFVVFCDRLRDAAPGEL
jgi:hypothetical protein